MTVKTNPYDPSLLLTDDKMIAGALKDALNDPDPRVLPMVLNDVAKVKGLSVAELARGLTAINPPGSPHARG